MRFSVDSPSAFWFKQSNDFAVLTQIFPTTQSYMALFHWIEKLSDTKIVFTRLLWSHSHFFLYLTGKRNFYIIVGRHKINYYRNYRPGAQRAGARRSMPRAASGPALRLRHTRDQAAQPALPGSRGRPAPCAATQPRRRGSCSCTRPKAKICCCSSPRTGEQPNSRFVL